MVRSAGGIPRAIALKPVFSINFLIDFYYFI
jgi:hypothetical protein